LAEDIRTVRRPNICLLGYPLVRALRLGRILGTSVRPHELAGKAICPFNRLIPPSYSVTQETNVLLTNDSHLTTELHTIQAQLLHYASLLEDFRKSVTFVKNTPNPILESREFTDQARRDTNKLMRKECDNLLSEIERLAFQLKNITDLVRVPATARFDDR